jgi:hypothetical protein
MRRKDFWIGSGLLEDNNPMPYVVVLFVAIDVVVVVVTCPLGCLYPSFYIQGGEVTKKVTELVTTLSRLGLYLN